MSITQSYAMIQEEKLLLQEKIQMDEVVKYQ